MKIKIFKPIKRFWRGLTKRMRVAILLLCASALLLAGFGIYMLARPEAPPNEATSTLFPGVDRDRIASVLCHTRSGNEYTVKGEYYTIPGENGDPRTYRRFFIVTADGKSHDLLSLDGTKLSYFVVGTGKNYVFSPVVSAPESGASDYAERLAEYEAKKRELGFGEDSPYYELTTVEGDVYRVYFGIKDVTGTGYYVRLAGEETIYATKSAFIGDLLGETGPESLIESTIFIPSQNNYAYAYPQKYSIYDFVRTDEEGTVVTEDAYSVGYHLKDANGNFVEGELPLEPYEGTSEAARLYREAIIDFFVGRKIGECNETFTFEYPSDEEIEEELRGTTVTIDVATIDHITTRDLKLSLKYLPMRQREASQKLSVYAYTAPADITSYIPDSDALLSMLEDVLALEGTVVKLGLDDATISGYNNLFRHQIWIRYPMGSTISASGSINSSAEDADAIAEEEFFRNDANFMEGRIYISDKTDRGTRYVASMFYDLVVEVDAASLEFLDKSPLDLVDDLVLTAPITDVESFTMYWNYGDGKWLSGAYRFAPTVEKVKGGFTGEYDASGQPMYQYNDEVTKLTATPVSGGDAIVLNPDIYYQLYSRMTYTRYKGEHGLSDGELDALLKDGNRPYAMRLEQTLADGTLNYWEFYPVSANRVIVNVKNGKYASAGARFYIYGTAFSDITSAYLHLMEGTPFNYEQQ